MISSDEKEMPSVQEGDTLVANAGQGITAGTSTYSSKLFGRGERLFPASRVWESTAVLAAGTGQTLNILYYTDEAGNFTLLPEKIRLYTMLSAIPILMLPM